MGRTETQSRLGRSPGAEAKRSAKKKIHGRLDYGGGGLGENKFLSKGIEERKVTYHKREGGIREFPKVPSRDSN